MVGLCRRESGIGMMHGVEQTGSAGRGATVSRDYSSGQLVGIDLLQAAGHSRSDRYPNILHARIPFWTAAREQIAADGSQIRAVCGVP
jgi:hypothetical protein